MVATSDSVLYIESHRKWYVVGFVTSIIVFAWAAFIAHHHVLAGWEQRILVDVNDRSNSWVSYSKLVSEVGGSLWTAVVAVVLTFAAKLYRLSWRLSASFLLATALTYAAKHIVSRAQPIAYVPDLHVRAMALGTAFPSGATAIATILSLSLLPYMPVRWRLIIPLWIGAVGVSRLYLGLYAPLDILGGLALGVFLVSLIRIMPQSVRVILRLD